MSQHDALLDRPIKHNLFQIIRLDLHLRLDLQIALFAGLPETDPAMNILSLTQVYLDILCHVTYILDPLQDASLRRGSERSVLEHDDVSHIEEYQEYSYVTWQRMSR